MTRIALIAVCIVACSKPGQDPRLQRAIDCIGQPEQVLRDALGKPDLELPGPNTFDKKLVYKDAQLTIDLVVPDGTRTYEVFSVGTGAVDDADRFGGAYDRPVFGIHHGESIADVQSHWGSGEPPGPSDPPHRKYPAKLSTSSGKPISVEVFYRDDQRGVYHLSFRATKS